MEKEKCVLCDEKVEGAVEDVPLTICCEGCCTTSNMRFHKVYQGRSRVSKTRARSVFFCIEEDLAQLRFTTLPNPVEREGRPMKLYLIAEVEYLGKQRQEMLLAEQAKKDAGAVIGKKIALEAALKTNLSKMDKVLRHYLLGDYLDKGTETEMTWEGVYARFNVLDRVKEILDTCDRAHPLAAFEFCMDHPMSGPLEFQERREKIRAVFHLEGARILYHLPCSERERLAKTVLKDVYEEFIVRNSYTLIRGHLQNWFSEQTALEIMEHPATFRRLENGGEELGIARKLKEFWNEKDDKTKRTEKLKSALKAKGMALPADCAFCDEYITGEVDCDLEEAVGVVELYTTAESRGQRTRRTLRNPNAESKFRSCLYQMKVGYTAAVQEATRSKYWRYQHTIDNTRFPFADINSMEGSLYSESGSEFDDIFSDDFGYPLLFSDDSYDLFL